MRRDSEVTELLARELLAVGSSETPEQSQVDAVRRQLDAVRDVLRFDAANAPSEAAVRRAHAIFAPRPAAASVPVIDRLRAVLAFDGRTAQPGLGFRGVAATSLLRYEAGDLLIDLAVGVDDDADNDRYSLTGQIDGAPDDLIAIDLRAADGVVVATASQAAHESFSLTVAPGVYDLVARFGTTELVVPDIRIG